MDINFVDNDYLALSRGQVMRVRAVFVLFCALFLISCGPAYTYTQPEQMGDGWQTASLETVGINERIIGKAVDKIRDGTYPNVHSILLVKDNKLVFEVYFDGYAWDYDGDHFQGDFTSFQADTLHTTMSVTKSFTSALVGIAIDQGFISSVSEPMFAFFPDYAHLGDRSSDLSDEISDEISSEISLGHLLSMSSGLAWNEWEYPLSDTRNDLIQLWIVPDPVAYILSKPVQYEPGTHFYYNGGGVNILGEVIQETTGLREDQFAQKYLFQPLGITDCEWDFINEDVVHASGNLMLRPRDMAKFGTLFLNDGIWNGERILSEEWIQASTRKHMMPPVTWADGYGYLWWLKTYPVGSKQVETYFADGWGGQRIMVVPEMDMVIVFTGGNYEGDVPIDEIITRYILPAVEGALILEGKAFS